MPKRRFIIRIELRNTLRSANTTQTPVLENKRSVIRALRFMLRPVIRLLIEVGFSFRDFNEIAKLVYVEVASAEFGLKGRPTNMSRVAIMTGLTRREVARLRKVIDVEPVEFLSASTVAGRVLTTWHQEPLYLLDNGRPKPLPVRGHGSLNELVERVRGDVPASAIIKELTRVEAVYINDGIAYARSSQYMPSPLNTPGVERLQAALNFTANLPSGQQAPTPCRQSGLSQISGGTPADESSIDLHARKFLRNIHDWLETSRSGS